MGHILPPFASVAVAFDFPASFSVAAFAEAHMQKYQTHNQWRPKGQGKKERTCSALFRFAAGLYEIFLIRELAFGELCIALHLIASFSSDVLRILAWANIFFVHIPFSKSMTILFLRP